MANEEKRKMLERPLEALNLSSRTFNCLKNSHIHTVGELVQNNEKDLFKIKNCGRKHVDEIKDALARIGLSLGIKSEDFGHAIFASASAGFTITFDATLSPEQIKSALQALADYYRACGGVGFEIDFELEDVVRELSHV